MNGVRYQLFLVLKQNARIDYIYILFIDIS